MKNRYVLLLAFVSLSSVSWGQVYNRPVNDTVMTPGVRVRASVGGIAATGRNAPFWIRSNQFGTVPFTAPTAYATVGATAIWGDPTQNRKPYVKAGLEVVGNLNRASQVVLPEAYAALRLGKAELYVGRRKEIYGLTDTLLTTGSIAWSGNALPITQVRLGTSGFAPLGFTKNFVAVNAYFSHGWIADNDSMQNVWLHTKGLFVRLGKPDAKIRFYGGINHFAQWGGYSRFLTDAGLARNGFLPSSFSAYRQVVFPIGNTDPSNGQLTRIDSLNQIGNHLGSIDAAMEIRGSRSSWFLYHQHIFEDNSGLQFKNFPDGLWGARWRNEQPQTSSLQLKQLTAEFVTSLSRSGTDKIAGNDDYFFNGQYLGGWVHQNNIIGTPVFTRTVDIPDAIRQQSYWMNRPNRPIGNNAVQTMHLATYLQAMRGTSFVLFVTASRFYELERIQRSFDQLYTSLEISNLFGVSGNAITTNIKLSYDAGELFNGNLGAQITLRKQGCLY